MIPLIRNNFTSVKSEVPRVNFNGAWINQLGSTMTIEESERGIIKGKYKTKKGKPEDEEEFNLIGIVSGDLITFSVDFGKYGSLTSWTGQLTVESNIEEIRTLWHLALNKNDEDEEDTIWSAILTGADTFRRI